MVGITLGAVILQLLRTLPNHFGYTLLSIFTAIYLILGTLVIRQVKSAK
jgi:hypothetical protein